jgi:signal peptidase I
MLVQLVSILAWVALPALIIAIGDDWFLRPRRRVRGEQSDPGLLMVIHFVLPVLLIAAVLRVLADDRLDFSLLLVLVAAIAGLVWLIDKLLFSAGRRKAAAMAGLDPGAQPLPLTVDYARSLFPIALIALLVRSFLFEPFRIPSDSMMPTLQDGDFILVNKYAYGLRLPVLDRKIVKVGELERGDVVVFRFPPDPSVHFVKRVVGLPGDRVRVLSDQLIVNGQAVRLRVLSRYDDGCYHNFRLESEILGHHEHQVLSCLTPNEIVAPASATCARKMDGNYNYECLEPQLQGERDRGDSPEMVVPAGHYLMIGDNRDNSDDSRDWGFVPDQNIVGKATYIWFNWDLRRPGRPLWSRIGHPIE